jgi:hypothetical protein
MDAHERAAVERRLSEVNFSLEAVPKGVPRPNVLNRWHDLLEEKEHLEDMLSGSPRFDDSECDKAHSRAPLDEPRNVEQIQSANRPSTEHAERSQTLAQERPALQNARQALPSRLRDPDATMPHTARSRGDVMIWGRTRMKLEEAIERALDESDRPLRADEIAQVIAHNEWIKEPCRNNYVEAIRGALQRHGNKLGLVSVGNDRRCRRYWLNRRGAPPDPA